MYCMFSLSATPYFKIIPPESVTVQEGLTGSMTCVVVGDYDSTETPWTYNETKVQNGSGVTVQGPLVGNGMAVFWLTFTNVTDILGDYTCGTGAGSKATATLKKRPPGHELVVRSCYVKIQLWYTVQCKQH